MVRVKICGMTNLEDALLASRFGADAVGFIFCPSPRGVAVEKAAEICAHLPPFLVRVGVFANQRPEDIRAAVDHCGLDVVQLHGEESPSDCATVEGRVVKAFRLRGEEDLDRLAAYKVDAYLLDTHVEGELGGTGRTFDWELAVRARTHGPVILAGGLSAHNVGDAVRRVRPYAVDVASGVEREPGRKDPERLRAFLRAVHEANRGLEDDPAPSAEAAFELNRGERP